MLLLGYKKAKGNKNSQLFLVFGAFSAPISEKDFKLL